MRVKSKYGDPVVVLWNDAFMDNAKVHTLAEVKALKPLPQRSCGFYISENKEGLTIASTLCDSDGGTVDGILLIPTPWVTEVRKV